MLYSLKKKGGKDCSANQSHHITALSHPIALLISTSCCLILQKSLLKHPPVRWQQLPRLLHIQGAESPPLQVGDSELSGCPIVKHFKDSKNQRTNFVLKYWRQADGKLPGSSLKCCSAKGMWNTAVYSSIGRWPPYCFAHIAPLASSAFCHSNPQRRVLQTPANCCKNFTVLRNIAGSLQLPVIMSKTKYFEWNKAVLYH